MFNNIFNRFFPVPHFLVTPSFGLDISDESLKFIQLINTNSGIKVGHYGERKIPPHIIESGHIKEPKKLEEILKTLRKEENVKSVRVSLPEEQVYLFKLQLEKANLVNVRESIELVLEDHVPLSAPEAIFDYEILNEDPQFLEIQVAVIPKNIIDDYLAVFQDADIAVQTFELEAQSVARAVIKQGDLDTYMIVDFGEKRTGIFIISRGVAMFTSTLGVGGVMLNEMIAKNFKISPEAAETMKRTYGLQRNTENKEIFSVLLNIVSVLRDELVKHFVYWHTHKDEEDKSNPPIKRIILCGGDSNLIGLPEYLSVSMKSSVETANVWINITNTEKYIPDMSFKEALSFATAIGLALGDYYYD
jgi:type IV pilus assembly protein PilM